MQFSFIDKMGNVTSYKCWHFKLPNADFRKENIKILSKNLTNNPNFKDSTKVDIGELEEFKEG
jgi:hypothetical protein